MAKKQKTGDEQRRVVRYVLETCSGTTREQAEEIARRMREQPDGDLLDLLTM